MSSVARPPPGFETHAESAGRRSYSSDSMQHRSSNSGNSPFDLRIQTANTTHLPHQSFVIRIPETSQEADKDKGGTHTVFHVKIQTNFKSWTVLRRFRQFDALHHSLSISIQASLPRLPSKTWFNKTPEFIKERSEDLQEYLRSLGSIPEAWESSTFLSFLESDDSKGSLSMLMDMTRVVEHYASKNKALERICTSLQHQLRSQHQRLEIVEARLQLIDSDGVEDVDCQSSVASRPGRRSDHLHAGSRPDLDSTDVIVPATFGVNERPKLHGSDGTDGINLDDESEHRDSASSQFSSSSLDPGGVILDLVSPKTPPNRALCIGPNAQAAMLGGNSPWGSMMPQPVDRAGPCHLVRSLVPSNTEPTAVDHRVEELLNLVQPNDAANRSRQRIFNFISGHVKRTLGATCFAIGSFASKCYLPDQEISVSPFLCHGELIAPQSPSRAESVTDL